MINFIKKSIKWMYKDFGKLSIFLSYSYGLLIAWYIKKDNLTQLLFHGKNFSGRSFVFKSLFIFLLAIIFASIFILIIRLVKSKSYIRTNEVIDNKINLFFTQKWLYRVEIILFILLLIVTIIQLLVSLNPTPNDDAFVYYNYARNMVEGRFFAYDSRNIPSEGFTSWIYLLLLTPFEFFKINMPFASIIINLIAIIGIIITLTKLIKITLLIPKQRAMLLTSLLVIYIANDVNTIFSLELGLETMLGPLISVLACYSLAKASISESSQRSVISFFVTMFLAYLIRPESMAFIALVGLPVLLLGKNTRKKTIQSLVVFLVVVIMFHVIKYFIFGDILPTGFYRKVSVGSSGSGYVRDWIINYKNWIIAFFILLLPTLVLLRQNKSWTLFSNYWFYFLLFISLLTILFFTQTRPLIGGGYRFLMTPIMVLYFFLSLLFIYIFDQLIFSDYLKKVLTIFFFISIIIYNGLKIAPLLNNGSLFTELNILSKAESATEEHKYLQFGYYLKDHLSNPEETTIVFGDAGAIPYSLTGRLIDTNGLTEPAIAHLFLLPDGPQKNQAFIDHILSQNPDIVVLCSVGEMQPDGTCQESANGHSPFREVFPIDVYKAYLDYGIIYGCSVKLYYYTTHIGLSTKSPQYPEIRQAVLSYCEKNGYILQNGLTISNGDERITFPRE